MTDHECRLLIGVARALEDQARAAPGTLTLRAALDRYEVRNSLHYLLNEAAAGQEATCADGLEEPSPGRSTLAYERSEEMAQEVAPEQKAALRSLLGTSLPLRPDSPTMNLTLDLLERLQAVTSPAQEADGLRDALDHAYRRGWIGYQVEQRGRTMVSLGANIDAALLLRPKGADWFAGDVNNHDWIGPKRYGQMGAIKVDAPSAALGLAIAAIKLHILEDERRD